MKPCVGILHLKEKAPLLVFTDWFGTKKFLLLGPWADASASGISVEQGWARSRGCCWVCGRSLQLTGLIPGVMELPSEPWSVGLALRQGLTFRSANSGPVTRCADECGSCQVPGRIPASSLGSSLGRKNWTELLTGAGTESLGCFKVNSQNWVCSLASRGMDGCVSYQVPKWLGLPLDNAQWGWS